MNREFIQQHVANWIEQFVVGLNLCPFAKRELIKNRVRFEVSGAIDERQLLADLAREIELLANNDSIETTLLIHPDTLQDFLDYNQFLDTLDEYLMQNDFDGVFQIASFHPSYQFSGTQEEDAENYSNKSPYPMLHILREESLTRAIDSYTDAELIPEQNIQRLRGLGIEKITRLLRDCSSI